MIMALLRRQCMAEANVKKIESSIDPMGVVFCTVFLFMSGFMLYNAIGDMALEKV